MPLLEVRNVSKHFGGLKAVNNCSLAVERHQIVGLIGPNGAGKTTLFNVIAGFLAPTSGEVYFKGEKISGLEPYEICQKGVARTFQTPHGFAGMTVMENMMTAPLNQKGESFRHLLLARAEVKAQQRQFKEKALRLLAAFGMADRQHEYVGNLSAGEARVLEMARQLMLDPEILLLDEPAAGINPALQHRLADIIKDLRQNGLTFLVVDHNLGFIMGLSDYIYVMDRGSIIAQGPPEEIAHDKKVREIYLGRGAA